MTPSTSTRLLNQNIWLSLEKIYSQNITSLAISVYYSLFYGYGFKSNKVKIIVIKKVKSLLNLLLNGDGTGDETIKIS